jgi:hypothetical protein
LPEKRHRSLSKCVWNSLEFPDITFAMNGARAGAVQAVLAAGAAAAAATTRKAAPPALQVVARAFSGGSGGGSEKGWSLETQLAQVMGPAGCLPRTTKRVATRGSRVPRSRAPGQVSFLVHQESTAIRLCVSYESFGCRRDAGPAAWGATRSTEA